MLMKSSTGAYLGYNSELGALVYDPRREPRGKIKPEAVAPPVPPSPTPSQLPKEEEERDPTYVYGFISTEINKILINA